MSLWVLFVCSSLRPGVQGIADEPFPLNTGFSLIFNCPAHRATLLSLPATFATAYGFVFSFGKLLHALACSKLLPDIFSKTVQPQSTPFAAIILGSAISYIICLLVYFFPQTSNYLFNICIINAFVSYCAQCIGFLFMRKRFGRLPRLFHSPVGISGALYAFFIFLFGIVSVIGFQDDKHAAFFSALVIWGAFSLYYVMYAKHRQTFSVEEQKILLVAHVINHNIRGAAQRKAKGRKKARGQSTGATSSNNPSRSADSSRRPSLGLDIARPSLTESTNLTRPRGTWMMFMHRPKVLSGFVTRPKNELDIQTDINNSNKSSRAAGKLSSFKPAILVNHTSPILVRAKVKSQSFLSNTDEEKYSDLAQLHAIEAK